MKNSLTDALQTEYAVDELANRTLDILDRWSDRLEGHLAQKRETTRNSYRRKIYLDIPKAAADVIDGGESGMAVAYARDLSQSGVGFVFGQNWPAEDITVCFPLDGGQWLRIAGKIVRRRQVHNGFWEYGVLFTARADADNPIDENSIPAAE